MIVLLDPRIKPSLALSLFLFCQLNVEAGALITMTNPSGFAEGGSDGSIMLVRTKDASFAFSVDFFFSDDTATAGIDYVPQIGRLDFAVNETVKTFVLRNPVIDNGKVDSPRSLRLNLTNATHDVEFHSPSIEFTIRDNERPNILDRSFQFAPELPSFPVALGEQQDGKILVQIGRTNIVRLLPNGARDPSFRRITLPDADFLVAAWPQPGNRWVISLSRPFRFVKGDLFRIGNDGSIDRTFNPTEWLLNLEGTPNLLLGAAAVQADGRMLLLIGDDSPEPDQILRVNPDGTRDETFAPVSVTFAFHSILVQNDGKIVLAQNDYSKPLFLLTRYYPDGHLDESFRSPLAVGDIVEQIILEPNGTFLLAGSFPSLTKKQDAVILRLSRDGVVDPAFRTRPLNDSPYRILSLPDGQILYFHSGTVCLIDPSTAIDRLLQPAIPFGIASSLVLRDSRVIASSLQGFTATLTRLDFTDPDRPGVEFGAEWGIINYLDARSEGEGTFSEPIGRLGDSSKPLTVSFETRDGSARGGEDFTPQQAKVIFQPLEVVKSVDVELLEDSNPEGFEEFSLIVTTSGSLSEARARIRIADDDPGTVLRTPELLGWGSGNVL